jgi:hypothetical protein
MEFEGATAVLELYEGWYPDPDTRKRVKDRSRRFWVAIPRRNVKRLRALLHEAGIVFGKSSFI